MKIVIVGDGKVGSTLAKVLTDEGHDIVLIDNKSEALQRSNDTLDVMTVVGNGACVDVQKRAGVANSHLLIAATSSDELNLLCCMVAKKAGAKHTIARVRNPDYAEQMYYLKDELGLSLSVNPERAAAGEISRLIRFPSAVHIEPFARGRVELIEIKLREDAELNGKSLHELAGVTRGKVLFCAVQRGENVYIPDGSFVLQSGDRVSIVGAPTELMAFFKNLNIPIIKVRSVFIVGGGKIAYYLAVQLLKMGMTVTLVERSQEKCDELCALLPKANVVFGDGNDQELLNEVGINDADAFVSLTGMDENNIILSMYAMAKGVNKVITKVNQINFPEMFERLSLDSIITPKQITSNQILSYVRAMQNSFGSAVESLYRLVDGKVEALEFIAHSNVSFLNIPLKSLTLRPQLLLACIVRNGIAIIPSGNDCVQVNDNVIVITTHNQLNELNDILKKQD